MATKSTGAEGAARAKADVYRATITVAPAAKNKNAVLEAEKA